jgi:hypothetical protein
VTSGHINGVAPGDVVSSTNQPRYSLITACDIDGLVPQLTRDAHRMAALTLEGRLSDRSRGWMGDDEQMVARIRVDQARSTYSFMHWT